MNWYYLDDAGQVAGPVTESALLDMQASGTLNNESQICREGTEAWTSLGKTFGSAASKNHLLRCRSSSAAPTVASTSLPESQMLACLLNVPLAAEPFRCREPSPDR